MTPMKTNGNLRVQNAIGNETLAAPMYEENPNHLYPQVHILNNSMWISSNLSESLGNNPNVVYPLWNVPPNFDDSAHGNAPSTSSTFLNNSIIGNAPNTSNNGNAPNINGNAPLPPPWIFVVLQKNHKLKKREQNKKILIYSIAQYIAFVA